MCQGSQDPHANPLGFVWVLSERAPLIDLGGALSTVSSVKLNEPFLYKLKAAGPEFGAGIKHAIDQGWLELHESGTYVRLLTTNEDLLPGQ